MMKKFINQVLIIILISMSIALIYNFSLKHPLPILKKFNSNVINGFIKGNITKTDPMSIRVISGEELLTRLDDDKIIILDARQPLEFEIGHIPSAFNLPVQQFETEYPNLSNFLNKKKIIITYCSEISCMDSELLAHKLFEKGLRKIYVFKGGYIEWQSKGYPVEKTQDNEIENN